MTVAGCELCQVPGGVEVVRAPLWRVVRVADLDFPGFYRVVWNEHIAEFSQLDREQRALCMDVVSRVETVLREQLQPTKINLAALGNMVPHLHWHVIARFDWDSHFPQPVWGERQRAVKPKALGRLPLGLEQLDDVVRAALQPLTAIH
jgi:diadenosine tetraphosphate (Ap4A) HIT family hydrolase